jgi:two-component system, NtrC family, response regulator AtoC
MSENNTMRTMPRDEFERLGGGSTRRVDVRVIAASNRDLKPLVDSGSFREDLYYRLNVVTITIPPLRERPEDTPVLAQYFVQQFGSAKEKHVTGISPEAMDLLSRYSWPGNVRELEHVIERAIVLTPHPIIMPHDLPEAVQAVAHEPREQSRGWITLDRLEQDYIMRVLDAHQRDIGRAADILGIHRKTLLRKLRRYGVPA